MSVSCSAPHIFEVLRAACVPELKHISYPVVNMFTHLTHSIVLYGGVFMYIACGSTTVNKLIKLFDPCFPHTYGPLPYNLRAYKAGRAPAGFPLWPYKRIHEYTTSLRYTGQAKVDDFDCFQRNQAQSVLSEDESLFSSSEGIDVPRSLSGSSSSD